MTSQGSEMLGNCRPVAAHRRTRQRLMPAQVYEIPYCFRCEAPQHGADDPGRYSCRPEQARRLVEQGDDGSTGQDRCGVIEDLPRWPDAEWSAIERARQGRGDYAGSAAAFYAPETAG
jgi:hypothetical protein